MVVDECLTVRERRRQGTREMIEHVVGLCSAPGRPRLP